jgi:RNase P/RNase MRP subunit p29
MKLIIQLTTAIVLSLPLVSAAAEKAAETKPAATEKPAAKPSEAAKPKRLPLKGTVVAITTRTLTIKGGEGKEDRKFTINKDTEILKGEATATTEDVKVGQTITGSYVKDADGTATMTKLQTAPKPSEPKKKPAAKDDAKTTKGEEEAPKKKASE